MVSIAVTCVLLAGLQVESASAPSGSTSSAVEPGNAKPIEVVRGHVASYPRVIQGRISSGNGKPVAGALIEWGPVYPDDAPREKTNTADNGSYRLEVSHAGRHYKLGISAPGFCPSSRWELAPGPISAPTELDIQLQPETTIEVTIVGKSGDPIPFLTVLPMTPESGFHSSFSMVSQPQPIPGHDMPTRCDEWGVCQLKQLLPAPPALQVRVLGDTDARAEFKERQNNEGWLSLQIRLDDKWIHRHQITRKEYFRSKGRIRVEIPDHSNPIVHRKYDGTIYAQVVSPDGKPVTNYRVAVRGRPERFTVNDPDGRFEWGNTRDPNGNYELRFFAKGYAPFAETIVPRWTSRAEPRRIQLIPAPSAEFQFVDSQTQKPLAGIPVVTGVSARSGGDYVEWNDLKNYADGHHTFETVVHVVSDTDGRITVPEDSPLATLIIQTAGYGRKIVTPRQRPEPDKNGLIRIPLEPAATIHATRAANSRIAEQGDNVYLEFQSTDGFHHMFHSLRLDANGECLIDSLAPGKYWVGLMHSAGHSSAACWLKICELKAGQNLELPLGDMTGKITVSGRTTPFTHVSLGPKPQLPVAGANPGEITVIATISDIDGYFEINGLHPGTYDVEQNRLNGIGHSMAFFLGSALKGPKELALAVDTHIDYIAGTVEPPESAVEASKSDK